MKSRGQSTLEYVIVLTAIVAAIIYAATNLIKPKVESSLGHVATEMDNAVAKIKY